jgi:hypothetical protein
MIIFEFFNTHINYLPQISLINMILKWHYINMFENFDIFLVVWHGFWLVWLWSYPLRFEVPHHSHFTTFFPIRNALPSKRFHGWQCILFHFPSQVSLINILKLESGLRNLKGSRPPFSSFSLNASSKFPKFPCLLVLQSIFFNLILLHPL